MVLLLLVRDLK
jgi:hypothetical protein